MRWVAWATRIEMGKAIQCAGDGKQIYNVGKYLLIS